MELQKISLIQIEHVRKSIKQQFEREGKSLTVPTYTVDLPGGAQQTFQHTRETVLQSGEDVLQEWETYEKNFSEFDSQVQQKCMEYAFTFGVKDAPTEQWRKKQLWLGIEYANEFDEKCAYVMTELFVTPEQLRDGFMQILRLSTTGVDKSVVSAAEDAFQPTV